MKIIYPCYEKIIKQCEETGGYSVEALRQVLEDESWMKKFAGFHTPHLLIQFYRMQGYMEAIKIISANRMRKLPEPAVSEKEKLSQELMEEIGRTVQDTISQFLDQRSRPQNVNYDNYPKIP